MGSCDTNIFGAQRRTLLQMNQAMVTLTSATVTKNLQLGLLNDTTYYKQTAMEHLVSHKNKFTNKFNHHLQNIDNIEHEMRKTSISFSSATACLWWGWEAGRGRGSEGNSLSAPSRGHHWKYGVGGEWFGGVWVDGVWWSGYRGGDMRDLIRHVHIMCHEFFSQELSFN